MTENKSRLQFSIYQLLVLMTLVAIVSALMVKYNWAYLPSIVLDFYENSPIERKIVIDVGLGILPTFIFGALVWSVIRLPYLVAGYRKLQKARRERREKIQQELLARREQQPGSPFD